MRFVHWVALNWNTLNKIFSYIAIKYIMRWEVNENFLNTYEYLYILYVIMYACLFTRK